MLDVERDVFDGGAELGNYHEVFSFVDFDHVWRVAIACQILELFEFSQQVVNCCVSGLSHCCIVRYLSKCQLGGNKSRLI